ncbi:MAG: hypothetical protein J3Q66DRAFT_402745 [Benniella sp.]|nr:MAG: hypothetical protein J3Q66DRAFT_402745 [Benniella sp.]
MASPTCTFLYLFLTFHFALLLLSTSSHGQSDNDVEAVSDAAYTRVGSKLYVIGGVFNKTKKTTISNPTFGDGQAIVLDLSASWDTAKPTWKRLRSGPRQQNVTDTLSADGSRLITFRSGSGSSYAMLYDVANNTWSPSRITVTEPDLVGFSAVTDPTTNKVYLPFGSLMYIYDFKTDTMASIPSKVSLTPISS